MHIHFLQSTPWQLFQESLGRRTFRDSGDGWEFLAILELSGGFKRLYCPYGPVVTSDQAFGYALEALSALAKRHGVTFIRLQPTGADISREKLRGHGLRPVRFSQPSHTWLLDLTQSSEDILAQMKQNTRNICRNYQKKGLEYEVTSDPAAISHLTSLLHQTAEKNRITVHGAASKPRPCSPSVPPVSI